MTLRYETITATSTARFRLHTLRRQRRQLTTAMVCGLVATGCAASPNSAQTTTPTHVTQVTPATPPPISPEVYETELRTAGDTLKAAFGGIGAPASLDLLASQVDSAASAVRGAEQRLTAIVSPTRYAAVQADLLGALANLANRLSEIHAQVQSRKLCTAPSVMVTVSNLPEADTLRRAAQALGPAGTELAATLPTPQPLPDRHENNGAILRSPGSGMGALTVENNTEYDIVMTISQSGTAAGSIYITRGRTAQMAHIPNGTYDLYVTGGTDWDGMRFTRSCAFRKLDSKADFATTKTERGITYIKATIKLSAADGNVRERDVPPDSLPK